MNTLDTLFSRKTVRSYTGEQLSDEQLATVMHAANAAPIGRGQYDTMHLTVIQNAALLTKIDTACAALFGDPSLHPLYGAPTLILVSTKVPEDMPSANVAFSNAAIVVQNMALAACELGLGVCHIWGAVRAINVTPEILEELHLPEGFTPCCAAALGVTEETYTLRNIPTDRIAADIIA